MHFKNTKVIGVKSREQLYACIQCNTNSCNWDPCRRLFSYLQSTRMPSRSIRQHLLPICTGIHSRQQKSCRLFLPDLAQPSCWKSLTLSFPCFFSPPPVSLHCSNKIYLCLLHRVHKTVLPRRGNITSQGDRILYIGRGSRLALFQMTHDAMLVVSHLMVQWYSPQLNWTYAQWSAYWFIFDKVVKN